jgi:hypothetical protein
MYTATACICCFVALQALGLCAGRADLHEIAYILFELLCSLHDRQHIACCVVCLQALGLCVGRGPLAGNWSVGQMCLLYIMPIYPAQGELHSGC